MKVKMRDKVDPISFSGTKEELIEEIELLFKQYEDRGYTNLYMEERYAMEWMPDAEYYMNGEREEKD